MSGKTINIDLNLFNVASGSKTKKKKPTSDKPIKIKGPPKPKSNKSQRNDLLKRIREHQEKQYQKLFGGGGEDVDLPLIKSTESDRIVVDNGVNNDRIVVDTGGGDKNFEESVKYLEEISKNPEPPINGTVGGSGGSVGNTLNKTSRNYESIMNSFNHDPIMDSLKNSTPLLMVSDFPGETKNVIGGGNVVGGGNVPVYGCLKGGTLPTYRNWKQTMKIRPDTNANMNKNINENRNAVVGAMKSRDEMIALQKVKDKIKEEKQKTNETATKLVRKKQKRILKRTYHVGKNAYKKNVGVLLANKTMRNHITSHTYALKQKPIQEIRKYLVKKGFIKVGSSAPNDVLRKIYESIMLIGGEVTNHNSENLLHNFFAE